MTWLAFIIDNRRLVHNRKSTLRPRLQASVKILRRRESQGSIRSLRTKRNSAGGPLFDGEALVHDARIDESGKALDRIYLSSIIARLSLRVAIARASESVC